MWVWIRLCACLALASFAFSTDAGAKTTPVTSDQPVGDFVDYLVHKSLDWEAAANISQKGANAAQAQQQYLLRDMLKRSSDELKAVKREQMKEDILSLAPAEVDEIASLTKTLESVDPSSDENLAPLSHALQHEFNALFSSLFGHSPHPIFYGAIVRDLSDKPESEPADIQILGFDVLDKTLRKNPSAMIGKVEIPTQMISVRDDNIFVAIPDDLKTSIHFAPPACGARNTFGFRLTAYYGISHGIWPLSWLDETPSSFEFSPLASPTRYEVSVDYSFEHIQRSVAKVTFAQKSDYISAQCEQAASASVTVDVPDGAREISCHASWIDAGAARSALQSCEIKGRTVVASGSITGPEKLCPNDKLCACVADAHGWLSLEGAYEKDSEKAETVTASAPGKANLIADSSVTIPLAIDSEAKLRHVSLNIRRRACPKTFDALDIVFSDDGSAASDGVSKSGAFRAHYADGGLTVSNATSEASADESTAN